MADNGLKPTSSEAGDLKSDFKIEITLSVGYQRKRAGIGGAWEGHFTTLVLLIAGVALVFFVVYELFTHFLP